MIVQCKHWRSRSITLSDVSQAVAAMALWEPPTVDVLVIASSGRFTADAVTWIDKHNHDGSGPRLEPWPESHLEFAAGSRAELVVQFSLRPR